MKTFNLELAKKGHPVQTRDGRKARIICFDRKDAGSRNIVYLIENENRENIFSCSDTGQVIEGQEKGSDLVIEQDKPVLYEALKQAKEALDGVKRLETLHQIDPLTCNPKYLEEAKVLRKMLQTVESAIATINNLGI